MRILLIMDPGLLVPPEGYGGIERLVEIFAKEYSKQGHKVHLLVTTGSNVEGCTIHEFGREIFPPKNSDMRNALFTAWKFVRKHRNDFDLIHNFGRLAYLLPVFSHPVQKIMTYQREISYRNNRLTGFLPVKNMVFTACSANLLSRLDPTGTWEVVYNGIDFSKYDFRPANDNEMTLMFLGRIERVKGCHHAIQVALETGNTLIIAGNVSPLKEEQVYFRNEIEPFIDGKKIKYVGAINDQQKNHYLGQSKALLFPIEWNEPFGIVMIEAMACGTPVIAFNKGSVNEVIDQGITGFKVNTLQEMVSAVENIDLIDREKCRLQAEKRFAASIIAERYLKIADPNRKKILIITTGQPTANPRVVKEYDALIHQGYRVKVLYTFSASWSYQMDLEKFENGKLKRQDFVLVGGNPFNQRFHYLVSRILFKVFIKLARFTNANFIQEMSIARSTFYLWMAAKRYNAMINIAHYLGALPAGVRAARKNNSLLIFDAEDYHRGEEPYYPGQIKHVIEMEDRLFPSLNYLTTASPLITKAYKEIYPNITSVTINNVFSKKYLQPVQKNDTGKLKLFWFSQYIGRKRGLETIIEALNILGDKNISLHILGNIKNPGYVETLLKQSNSLANIELIKSVPPDEVFATAAQFDIGIAAEIPYCENRNICLTNKIFTYLMAGNCVLASNTKAQLQFMEQHPGIGLLYEHDNANNLALQIKKLHTDRQFLHMCKINSSSLAANKMNWEKESERLVSLIEQNN
ncbi:MAG: glycosyltransferase [Ferruginibacter sp.]